MPGEKIDMPGKLEPAELDVQRGRGAADLPTDKLAAQVRQAARETGDKTRSRLLDEAANRLEREAERRALFQSQFTTIAAVRMYALLVDRPRITPWQRIRRALGKRYDCWPETANLQTAQWAWRYAKTLTDAGLEWTEERIAEKRREGS